MFEIRLGTTFTFPCWEGGMGVRVDNGWWEGGGIGWIDGLINRWKGEGWMSKKGWME